MTGWDVTGAEAAWLENEIGCETHFLPECLCDVMAIQDGVPINAVPMAERLLELGSPGDRFAFLSWASEVTASMRAQRRLSAVAD